MPRASLSVMGADWLRNPWQIKTDGKYFLLEALWIGCEISTVKSDRSSCLTRLALPVQRLSLSPCLPLTHQAYPIRLREAEERAREGEAFRDIIWLPKAPSTPSLSCCAYRPKLKATEMNIGERLLLLLSLRHDQWT